MSEKRDIVDRLIDFENHGYTATERFTMRMDAAREIRCLRQLMRDGAVAARLAHNQEVVGSSPAPASSR